MGKAKPSESIPTAETINEALPVPAPLAPTNRPSAAMLALFAPTGDVQAKLAQGKIKRLTLPPIIKPSAVGPGCGFMGTIQDVIDSPVSTYKSRILKMKHPTGGEFCWPANAVTAGALAQMAGIDRADFDLENPKHVKLVIGRTIIVEGLGPSTTQMGKSVNLFNIAEVVS